MRRRKLVAVMPDRPAFVCNRESGGDGVDMIRDHNIPVQLCQVVHFFIQNFSAREELWRFLTLLVSPDMLWVKG